MIRNRFNVLSIYVVGLLGILTSSVWGVPPADQLVSSRVHAFVSVQDVPLLIERWNKTEVGTLLQDPVMQPFAEDLKSQLAAKLEGGGQDWGIKLEDLRGLASGELSYSLVQPSENPDAESILLLDVTGKEEQAREVLEKARKNLLQKGGKESKKTIHDVEVTHMTFPPNASHKEEYHTVSFLHEGLLGICGGEKAADIVLSRLTGKENQDGNLADDKAYQAVLQRCQKASDTCLGASEETKPHLRWFVRPLGLGEILHNQDDHNRRKAGPDILKVLKNQGFAALQGIGGFLQLAEGTYGAIHQTFIYAPLPYEKAMQMLSFQQGEDYAPQSWVDRDLCAYTSFYMDLPEAEKHFGGLFDNIIGEGEEGIWNDILNGLKEDPLGPKIDVRAEVFALLGPRVTVLSDQKLPVTPSSERTLMAIQITDEERVRAAVEKLVKDDPAVKKQIIKEISVWEIDNNSPEGAGGNSKPQENEAPQQAILPNPAVAVSHGHLFISSHMDLMVKVLSERDEREVLTRDVDYRLVNKELNALVEKLKENGGGRLFMCDFTRNDEQHRTTYELFRQGKLRESESMLAGVIQKYFGEENNNGDRRITLDGSKLPDYEVARRYLSPGGSFATLEEDGWLMVGFSLRKALPAGDLGTAEKDSNKGLSQ